MEFMITVVDRRVAHLSVAAETYREAKGLAEELYAKGCLDGYLDEGIVEVSLVPTLPEESFAPDEPHKVSRESFHAGSFLDELIAYSALPKRVRGALEDCGIETIGELCRLKRSKIRRMKNIAEKSMKDIDAFLIRHGLRIGMREEELRDYKG